MRLGLHALGIGAGADRRVIDAVAVAAQDNGFATLWAGEHVVMVDRSDSRYPYSEDGRITVPARADWLDPLMCLGFAAAATTTIGIATGVLLLPEHNPLLVAKQAASLDHLSGGRLTLGVGIGWSRAEFDALGVPFARRATPCASPRRTPRFVVGGNSDAALRRIVAWGDGWYGFYVEDVEGRVELLRRLCRDAGRDPAALQLAVALREPQVADVQRLAGIGVDELVLVQTPPGDAAAVPGWMATLADRWIPALS